jgi:dipeptidyl aminopeptidase/acylaminoacyl peptidase
MTQLNFQELLKQGDAKAIAALMNHYLQPKGITTKVSAKNDCLQLMLEAAQVPDQQTLVALIGKLFASLGAESIRKVKIYGRQIGEEFPAWHEDFEVEGQTVPNFVELAKQGDVSAITTLIGQWLNSQSITTKASLKDGCLQVMLESVQVPEQQVVVPLIRDGLIGLDIQYCKKIKIYGRETGEDIPDWTQEFDLDVNHKQSTPKPPSPPPSSTRVSSSQSHTPPASQRKQIWRCVSTLTGHSRGINSVAISPDGQTLASGSNDKTIKLWQLSTGDELRTLTGHSGLSAGVYSVAFSPDGQTLVSGSDDKTIKLWQVDTGRQIRTFTGHTCGIRSVAISRNGKTLASGESFSDNTIKLWDLATGQELHTLTGHSHTVTSLAISRDGKTLASGSVDKTTKVWDLATGAELYTLFGPSDTVCAVAFSPDGQALASGSSDKIIRIWHVPSHKLIHMLIGHLGWVCSVAFSPDGKTLASGGSFYDNTIKLWRLDTGKELCTLTGHSSQITSVTFSPDGQTLVSASEDKTIMIWQCD